MIVCGQLLRKPGESWKQHLNRRYDERREDEGSNAADSRKPRRSDKWEKEEAVLADKRIDEKRRSAIARWFVRRFPISAATETDSRKELEKLKTWDTLSDGEKTGLLTAIDRWVKRDEED